MNTLKFNQLKFNHIGEANSLKLQEKSVIITENGSQEIVPDKGYGLGKVKVDVNVKDVEVEYYDISSLDNNVKILWVSYSVQAIYDGSTTMSAYIKWDSSFNISNVQKVSIIPNFMVVNRNYPEGKAIKSFITELMAYGTATKITKEEFYNGILTT